MNRNDETVAEHYRDEMNEAEPPCGDDSNDSDIRYVEKLEDADAPEQNY